MDDEEPEDANDPWDDSPSDESSPSDDDTSFEDTPSDDDTSFEDTPSDDDTSFEEGGPVQDSGERQCTNCGATLTRYSKFCTECGARQDLDETGEDYGGAHDHGGQQDYGPQPGHAGQYDRGRQRSPGQQHGGGQPGHGGQPPRGQPPRGQQDRAWTAGPESDTGLAAITHILALFLGILGPIIIYAVTDDPFVKQNAANATNWQIMLIVYSIISGILILLLIGFLLIIALIIMDIAFIIIAAIKASDGEAWEYPLTPELL